MALCKNLGDRLNRIRKAQGLSITEFSEQLGIARSSLQTILNGTGNPRSDTIEQIAGHLNLDYQVLLMGPQTPEPNPLTEQQIQSLLLLLEGLSANRGAHHE